MSTMDDLDPETHEIVVGKCSHLNAEIRHRCGRVISPPELDFAPVRSCRPLVATVRALLTPIPTEAITKLISGRT